MKRFKILMAAAIVFGTASAFTTQSVAFDEIYVKIGEENFQLLEDVQDQGSCRDGGDVCEHTLINGQYVPTAPNRIWVED